MHQEPILFHKFEVLVNHFVELIAPFLILVPLRSIRLIGGIIQIKFQVADTLQLYFLLFFKLRITHFYSRLDGPNSEWESKLFKLVNDYAVFGMLG